MRQITLFLFLMFASCVACQKEQDCTTNALCISTNYMYRWCDQNPGAGLREAMDVVTVTKKEYELYFSVCDTAWYLKENRRAWAEMLATVDSTTLTYQLMLEYPSTLVCY